MAITSLANSGEDKQISNTVKENKMPLPCNILPVILADKSEEFLLKANNDKLTAEYLEECSRSDTKFKRTD